MLTERHSTSFAVLLSAMIVTSSCGPDIDPIPNRIEFSEKLSDYDLFTDMRNLEPASDVTIYELSSPLFTDYASKQRLIKLPKGTAMTAPDGKLPEFPEGTILAKTFYYDRPDAPQGKHIIETRLLIKDEGNWNAATYRWNELKQEAHLLKDGARVNASYKSSNGVEKTVGYLIPTEAECSSCHRTNSRIVPLGPELRNLNIGVSKRGRIVNQINYFIDIGILNPVDNQALGVLPNWADNRFTIDERARAYMHVNCSHCHNSGGWADDFTSLDLTYDTPFDETRIGSRKKRIAERIMLTGDGKMPRLGTTVLHTEGIQLIRDYIEGL